jgi:pimeloyl-ACP methyl ester carboxylesterase
MIIRANDTELYYERYGDGEPVIFSHGWLDDCSVWDSQARIIATDHAVFLYNLRGHGKSEKPRGDYSVQTLADDLNGLIQALKLEKVILVGFSLGGMLSMLFTLQNPAKVSKLVLVGAAAKMPQRAHILGALIRLVGYRTLLETILVKFRFYKPSRSTIEAFMSRAMLVPEAVAYDCFTGFTNKYDIRDNVSEIKVPTLIVVGQKDMGTPIKCSQYLNREIKSSELRIIPGGGHEVMVDKPDAFNQLLKGFLLPIPVKD